MLADATAECGGSGSDGAGSTTMDEASLTSVLEQLWLNAPYAQAPLDPALAFCLPDELQVPEEAGVDAMAGEATAPAPEQTAFLCLVDMLRDRYPGEDMSVPTLPSRPAGMAWSR